MVKKTTALQTLSYKEQKTLVDIMRDLHGLTLSYEEFADAALGMFENIPGFETISPAKASHFVLTLWSTYHGQESNQV